MSTAIEFAQSSLQAIFDKSIRIGVSGKLLIEKTGLIQETRKQPLELGVVASREGIQSSVLEREEGKPLGTRERNNLLLVIRCLADEAKLDLSGPYKLGTSIASALNNQMSAETIGKILIAASSVSGRDKAAAKSRKTKNVNYAAHRRSN